MNLEPAFVNELHRLSQLLYAGRDGNLGPSVGQWDTLCDVQFDNARAYMKRYLGVSSGANAEWAAILKAAVLEMPSHGVMRRAGQRLAEAFAERELATPTLFPNGSRYYRAGIPVIPRERPRLRWDVRTHRYVPSGTQLVYECR
jgi:hypothetical protein